MTDRTLKLDEVWKGRFVCGRISLTTPPGVPGDILSFADNALPANGRLIVHLKDSEAVRVEISYDVPPRRSAHNSKRRL